MSIFEDEEDITVLEVVELLEILELIGLDETELLPCPPLDGGT
jgi:hypothetical protein